MSASIYSHLSEHQAGEDRDDIISSLTPPIGEHDKDDVRCTLRTMLAEGDLSYATDIDGRLHITTPANAHHLTNPRNNGGM